MGNVIMYVTKYSAVSVSVTDPSQFPWNDTRCRKIGLAIHLTDFFDVSNSVVLVSNWTILNNAMSYVV